MKFIKILISILIFISFEMNSIAAISVGDGSSFVTKAEFAADINRLSNEMSQIENSIDARIDTLVSSYLNKNGIWNGQEQTLLVSNLPSFTSPGTLQNQTVYDLDQHKTRIVKNLSKSGLLVATIKWSSAGNYPRIFYLGSTTHVRTDNAHAKEFNIYFTEQPNTNTSMNRNNANYLKSKIQLGTSNYNVQSDGMISEIVLPKTGVANAMFFVTKDNSIWACENLYYYEFFVNLSISASNMPSFKISMIVY